MFPSVLLPLCAFIVLDANAEFGPTICGEETLNAATEESMFSFVLKEGEEIPANTACKWTITQETEGEELARSILIYLKPTNESNPNQCVTVRGLTAENEKIICAELGHNVVELSGQNVTVLFPVKKSGQQLKPFNLYYKLGNLKNNDCGPSSLTAEDAINHLQVPIESNCSWLLWGIRNEPLALYMKKSETSEESDHCVNVTEPERRADRALCAKNDGIFKLEKQPIIIKYAPPNSAPQSSGTFRVYYRMRNCGHYHLFASGNEKTLPMYTKPGDIPERQQCVWIIFGENKKPTKISIEHSKIANQCVLIECVESEIICADHGKNTSECPLNSAYVYFPVPGYPTNLRNFNIIYKSMNEESSDEDKCENIQLSAEYEKHTFPVFNGSETVPHGHHCEWSINDSTDKPIRISLETVGTNTENQCIMVKCADDRTENEVCALAGNNSVTCITKPVIVTYSAKPSVVDVNNFQVTYQIDSAVFKSSSLVSLSIVITVFSQTGWQATT